MHINQLVKNLNAEQFLNQYPEDTVAIVKRHYVDIYYDSVDTVNPLVQRAKEVKYIHSRGGFHIRNWVSNSGEFLQRTEVLSGDKRPMKRVVLSIVMAQFDPMGYLVPVTIRTSGGQSINGTKLWMK